MPGVYLKTGNDSHSQVILKIDVGITYAVENVLLNNVRINLFIEVTDFCTTFFPRRTLLNYYYMINVQIAVKYQSWDTQAQAAGVCRVLNI
jgi:hypothetical protein